MRVEGKTIRPLGNKVVVLRDESDAVSKGGIILPDTAKEKARMGKILAVGLGKKNDKGERITMDVEDGDHVLFSIYAGNECEIDGKKYLLMSEEEILAIVD